MEDGLSSFWGPVTSTDWCEKNYVHSSYIAEFFNTTSNVPGILLALIGLVNALRQRFEKRFSVLHISNMILAIGSMIYHATLQRVKQQGDETPMVWEMLLYFYILYSPDWHYRSTMPTFLFFYGALCAVVHAVFRFGFGFKVHYVVLCLICIPRAYKVFCKEISHWYFNPQGHALWHILMGFNSYFANTFLMFCRAQQREWDPKVVRFLGVFPYVKIQKPKSQ
ncbi:putative methionine--tRNA ligase-like [Hibiscus syriacus]|uniref:Methionine--tRNA ligase-like n=1 Tax=Hibiscus syriacus TaxID=106335 RepID=A0A6A3C4L2_HIBSY|nr:putative methionine--tRNA ligase-like [Hibiscus syriacus]